MTKNNLLNKMKSWKPLQKKSKSAFLEGIRVQSMSGDMILLSDLWRNNIVILKVLRRFGCPLCRYESRLLSDLKPHFDLLNVKLVGIGFEEVGLQEFIDGKYWDWDLYLDPERAVHKALGLNKMTIVQGLTDLLSFAARSAIRVVNKMGIKGDMYGDGFQLGGTFIVGAGDQGLLYEYRQTSSAIFPSMKEIFKACGGDPTIIDEITPEECLFYTESIAPKSIANTEASSIRESFKTVPSKISNGKKTNSTIRKISISSDSEEDDSILSFRFNDVDTISNSSKAIEMYSIYSESDIDSEDEYLSANDE